MQPATESDVLWDWARAEVASPRFAHRYGILGPRIEEALAEDRPSALSRAERDFVDETVRTARAPLLAGLRRLGIAWHAGFLGTEAVDDLRALNLPPFSALAPGRRLGDLAAALGAGRGTGSFAAAFATLRESFDAAKQRGRPLLASRAAAPFTILEGHARLAVLASRRPAGPVAVLIGVCPRLSEWRLHDDPAGALLA